MGTDWKLLLCVWLVGLSCGALAWYRVLKFYDSKNKTNKAKQDSDKPKQERQ